MFKIQFFQRIVLLARNYNFFKPISNIFIFFFGEMTPKSEGVWTSISRFLVADLEVVRHTLKMCSCIISHSFRARNHKNVLHEKKLFQTFLIYGRTNLFMEPSSPSNVYGIFELRPPCIWNVCLLNGR